MDIFDDAVVKAKEAFDIAYKKTNKVVSIQKLKFEIASLQNKRSKATEKLGGLYFDSIKNTEINDSNIKDLVDEISEIDVKIENLNAEINAEKNKRVCPNCQALVEDKALFCSICGTNLSVESDENE